jgi:ABC-type nitrate/sulfonate/bicarbonate transport system substrate-binding protein
MVTPDTRSRAVRCVHRPHVGAPAVHTIDLTYVGLGIHEELVAYVADQQEYYAQEGVHVALRDGCAWQMDRIRRTATIGLGRAVVSTVTDGVPWVVLCVNTQHPLFWLLARERYTTVEALKGRRIGVHPARTAPGCFARIALRKHGLDPDRDIQSVVLTPGDYSRHLRGLADGSLDAAFVGSTVAPEVTAQDDGLRLLAFVGDDLQVPTVGIAVDTTHLSPDDPAVQALVRAHRRALRAIHDDPDLAARYVQALVPYLTLAQARQHVERWVAPYFTIDGRHDPDVAARALSAVAGELAASTVPDAARIYRTQPPEEKSWPTHNQWQS